MIHLYCGDGKGKTTAACGLAARALGAGMKVLFVQFFKSGASSEIKTLERCGAEVLKPSVHHGRYGSLNEAEKAEVGRAYAEMLENVVRSAQRYGVIILDEAVSAYRYGMVPDGTLLRFLREEGNEREIVLTGREPPRELIEVSDYVTEMKKIKHPYEKGVKARKGIEF